jgi:hypothetical protein
MPWVTYPKVESSLYGYVGDGYVTAFLFSLAGISFVLSYFIKRISLFSTVFSLIVSILLCLIFYSKHSDFLVQKAEYIPENALIAAATAGYKLDYGFYLFGASAIALLFISIVMLAQLKIFKSDHVKNKRLNVGASIISILVFVAAFIFSGNYLRLAPDLSDKERYYEVLSIELEQMGKALINEDFVAFSRYNHPVMVESLGGKERLIDLLRANARQFRETNTAIKSVKLKEILDIRSGRNSIQILLTQEVVFQKDDELVEDIQKTIAISEDNGNKWYFINIEGKSKEEVSTFFPALNPDLDF